MLYTRNGGIPPLNGAPLLSADSSRQRLRYDHFSVLVQAGHAYANCFAGDRTRPPLERIEALTTASLPYLVIMK